MGSIKMFPHRHILLYNYGFRSSRSSAVSVSTTTPKKIHHARLCITMNPVSKSDPIAIVGAGAFGLSTALHLARAGYSNILVLDKGATVPSPFSAANDINKILRVEYDDDFYTNLAVEALRAWKTPLFAPHYHQTGFLHCVSEAAPEKASKTLRSFQASAERHPEVKKYLVPLNNRDDILRAVWQFQEGSLPGWKGYYNRYDGYAHSSNALKAVYEALVALGVRFLLGEAGNAAEILYEDQQCAMGAAAASLVPELGGQVVAKS
ncbi:hypothetical protein F5Y12DRAFT_38586 [Xylaria sp. FL1777]|nr:hypothetical protein F5Y12DRAFT_38586 [Xylaria sp. FL1777]